MYTQVEKSKWNKSKSVTNSDSQKKGNKNQVLDFVDNRSTSIKQQKSQLKSNYSSQLSVHKKERNIDFPDMLKSNIDNFYGYSTKYVKEYYDSDKYIQLKLNSYEKYINAHLEPGREKYFPYKGCNVVQQKKERVKPTSQMKGGVNVNDDAGLAKEADTMGHRASNMPSSKSMKTFVPERKLYVSVAQLVNLSEWADKKKDAKEVNYVEKVDDAKARAISTTDEAGTRTAGLESEWSKVGTGGRSGVKVVCTGTVGQLADHTILFETEAMKYQFETQNDKPAKEGQVEAITKVGGVVNMSHKQEKYDAQMAEIERLDQAFIAIKGDCSLKQFSQNHNFITLGSDVAKKALYIRLIHEGSGASQKLPQTTVTHSLAITNELFEGGYPDILRSSDKHDSIKAFRDMVLKESSALAKDLSGLIQKNLQEQPKGEGAARSTHRITGFLTQLVQDFIAVRERSKAATASIPEDEKHKTTWIKDYFGLLPKTPTAILFREGLSPEDQGLLSGIKPEIENALFYELLKFSKQEGEQELPLKVTNAVKSIKKSDVVDYINHIFTPVSGESKTYAKWTKDSVSYWRWLSDEDKAVPIFQYDKLGKEHYLRAAYEYRQVDGGLIVGGNTKLQDEIFKRSNELDKSRGKILEVRILKDEVIALLKEGMKKSGLKAKVMEVEKEAPKQMIIAETSYFVNNTEADGNCFYHAVAESLSGKVSEGVDQQDLRDKIVDAMISNSGIRERLFGEKPNYNDLNEVVGEILTAGEWADDYTPSFSAEALNIRIMVYNQDGSLYYTAEPILGEPRATVYLQYTGSHYNSMTRQPLVQIERPGRGGQEDVEDAKMKKSSKGGSKPFIRGGLLKNLMQNNVMEKDIEEAKSLPSKKEAQGMNEKLFEKFGQANQKQEPLGAAKSLVIGSKEEEKPKIEKSILELRREAKEGMKRYKKEIEILKKKQESARSDISGKNPKQIPEYEAKKKKFDDLSQKVAELTKEQELFRQKNQTYL